MPPHINVLIAAGMQMKQFMKGDAFTTTGVEERHIYDFFRRGELWYRIDEGDQAPVPVFGDIEWNAQQLHLELWAIVETC